MNEYNITFHTWVDFYNSLTDTFINYDNKNFYFERYNWIYKNDLEALDDYFNIIKNLLDNGLNPNEGLNALISDYYYNFDINGLRISDSILYNLYNIILYDNYIYKKITYYDIMYNYRVLYNFLDKTFTLFKSYGAIIDLNFIYNNLNFINNNNLYQINNIEFEYEIDKCSILGLLIDIISKYYPTDLLVIFQDFNFTNIKAINFDINIINNSTHTYSELLKSNLKFYSKFIQENTLNLDNLNDELIVGNMMPFENWDNFFYILINNNNMFFYNKTDESKEGFFNTIKYLLSHGFNAQEGFDKYIKIISTNINYGNYDITDNLSDREEIYTKIISLFKSYNVKLNISPIFDKYKDDYNDDYIINVLSNIEPLVDDIYISNISLYQQRGILLDSIANNYLEDLYNWNKIVHDNLLNFKYTDLLNIIGDYYGYNLIFLINHYANWSVLPIIQNPLNLISDTLTLTYKDLRYIRLKYYSKFLTNL